MTASSHFLDRTATSTRCPRVDTNDLVEPRAIPPASGPARDTVGFSGFIIAAFDVIVSVMFFVIWAAVTIPMVYAVSEMYSDIAPLLYFLAMALGFILAIFATGFAVLILDIRKQLVAIRLALSSR